ncbi:MAG: GAF domain-containing protein [Elusimicrobiota bacterium]
MEISDIKKFIDGIDLLNNEREIVTKFLDYGINVLQCESGSFFAVNENKKTLTFDIVRGASSEELSGISFKYTGIVGWCAQTKKDILVKDVNNNPVFTKKIDYATQYKTKSVIAITIGYGRDLFGIVEFINPKNKNFFDETDFDLIKLISYCVSHKIYIIRMENSIFEVNKRLDSAINNLSGGFIGIDNNGIIVFLNPRAREILDIKGDYVGKMYHDLDDYLYKIKELLGDSKNGKFVKRGELVCKINSVEKKIGFSTISLRAIDGTILGSAIIFQDISG